MSTVEVKKNVSLTILNVIELGTTDCCCTTRRIGVIRTGNAHTVCYSVVCDGGATECRTERANAESHHIVLREPRVIVCATLGPHLHQNKVQAGL